MGYHKNGEAQLGIAEDHKCSCVFLYSINKNVTKYLDIQMHVECEGYNMR